MAMKSLMYYVVLIPTDFHFHTSKYGDILNVFWRGLCVEDPHPGQFCQPPNPLTMTQAALVVPLGILIILYVLGVFDMCGNCRFPRFLASNFTTLPIGKFHFPSLPHIRECNF